MGHPQDHSQNKIKDLVKPDIHAELSESSWVSYKNAQRGSICWIYLFHFFIFQQFRVDSWHSPLAAPPNVCKLQSEKSH